MITQNISQPIAAQLQMFKEIEQKEQFLFVLGALVSKLISQVGWAKRPYCFAHHLPINNEQHLFVFLTNSLIDC